MNLTKSRTAKIAAGFAGFALALFFVVTPVTTQAQTTAELQAMINTLLAQIAALQAQIGGGSSSSATFSADLTLGSTGADVTALQQWLVSKGFLTMPAGVAMGHFGPLTQAAVAAYQTSKGISPASGYFGPITRASVNAGAPVVPPVVPPTGGGTTGAGLQGGAGSVDTYELVSGINNEEVGEGTDDVEVFGLDIEASDGSDIEFTAVRLDFAQGTANNDNLDDYFTEFSIWLDGEEFARVDASEFDEDQGWEKTVSLNDGAIIKAGETAKLRVKASGVNNIDSNDDSETWTLDAETVRFVDANGASISEDPGTGTRSFTVELFATAADTEFRITESSDSTNDAHIITLDASNDTDNVDILVYEVEIEGTADVHVDDLPVGVVVTGTTDQVEELVSNLTLWMDGVEVGSAGTSDCLEDTGCSGLGLYETFLFDDMDLTLEGGQTYEFVVKADFEPIDGTIVAAGDTIAASTTASLIEISGYSDIEDEEGDELAAADTNGTASSDASAVYVSGIAVEFVSADETVHIGTLAGDADNVELEIVFDITATGDDEVWVEGDFATQGTVAVVGTDGQFWATTTDSTTGTSTSGTYAPSAPTLSASGNTSSDDTAAATRDFHINAGETRTFTFKVTIPAGGDNVNAGARITGIKWGTTDADDNMNNLYTFNLGDLRTSTVTGLSIH